jgi:hypothetical protein
MKMTGVAGSTLATMSSSTTLFGAERRDQCNMAGQRAVFEHPAQRRQATQVTADLAQPLEMLQRAQGGNPP